MRSAPLPQPFSQSSRRRASLVLSLVVTCVTPAMCGASEASLDQRALQQARGDEAPALLSMSIDAAPSVMSADRALSASQLSRLAPAEASRFSASTIDYRAWLTQGRASVGLGLTSTAFGDAAGRAPWVAAGAPVIGLGLRYQLTPGSRLTFDSMAAARDDALVPRVRLGMEFRSPPTQVMGLSRGTFMRVQLSGASQLSVNYRGRKLALLLRSDF